MSRISELPIGEALVRVDAVELEKELQVEQKYLINYLGQLVSNISEEVGPNVFVAPFTFGGQLAGFIEQLNSLVLSRWVEGFQRRYSGKNGIKELITKALNDYEHFDQIVQVFEQEKLVKFKDLILLVLSTQLEDKFKDSRIQAGRNLFLAKLGRDPEIRPFFALVNQELAAESLEIAITTTTATTAIPAEAYVDLVGDLVPTRKMIKRCKSEERVEELALVMSKFLRSLRLKEAPDNNQRILRYSEKSRIQHQKTRKVFIGIFDDFTHCQTFKLFRNLSNELFEIEQFMDFCNERPLVDNFDLQMFVKLFQYPNETKHQLWLQDKLTRQLEATKVNMRETKEHLYKAAFMKYAELDFLKEWSRDFFVRNDHRRNPKPKKFKKNYEYIAKIENSRFFWRDSIYKLLELVKQMHTKVKHQSAPHALRYYQTMYQIAAVQMQLESDFLFVLLQEHSHNLSNHNLK